MLVAKLLDKLVYFCTLNGLGGGELVQGLVPGRGRGQKEDKLGALVGEDAPLSLGDQVTELGRVQLPLGQEGVTQGDDGPPVDIRGHGVGQDHGQVRPPVSPPRVSTLLHSRGYSKYRKY